MYRYFFLLVFFIFKVNSALALDKVTYYANKNQLTYNLTPEEEEVITKLTNIQNLYLNKNAKACLKAINKWKAPENIAPWIYIKKLKCIKLFSKNNRVYLYKKNIGYPNIWKLNKPVRLELVKALKNAIYFIIKVSLKKGKVGEVEKLLQNINTSIFFSSNKEKTYLFYIKARIFYNKKNSLLAKSFLNNSFYYHRNSSKRKYPFSLSAFRGKYFIKFIDKKAKAKRKKNIFYYPMELKAFNQLKEKSRSSKIFFNKHIQYLQMYHGSIRSRKVNRTLLLAYLALPKSKQNSFEVLKKVSKLKCVFLNKWVGKLFYKAKYKDIAYLYTNANPCEWKGDNYFRIAAGYYYQASYDDAEVLFKKLPKTYSGHNIIPRSMLFLSFLYIKKNQYNSAIKVLKKLVRLPKNNFHLQAYYFLYFLHKKQNNSYKAKFYYKQLLRKYPLTYYSLKLKFLDKSLPSFFTNKTKKRDKWTIYLDKPESQSWQKVKLLLKAGWLKESRLELKAWNLPTLSSGVFVYTYLLSQAHNFLSAIKLLYYLWEEDRSVHRKSLLKLLFPHFFKSLVEEYAVKNHLEPSVVFALIRQESGFKVDAHSLANAYGLMQMIISTANEVKKLLGIRKKSVSKRELFEAKTNIRYGTRHLRQLLKAWGGHLPLSLASYNVGYGNLSKWIKSRGPSFKIENNSKLLNEIWFDELPWVETSFYIKAILRNQFLYKGLYGKALIK
ncbi:MAG: transglycosylase SLT domain-containing protein [Bdellovibrionaceae bacterium]|nr:transglycosylase SLT domain-containing protein [Pseudobdellovibrionaceae bacterium]